MSLSNKGAGVDPRLQSVTNALFLNASDDVVMRSHVEGLTLQTGDILVDAVKIWDGTHYVQLELPNNDNEAGGWSLSAETYNMVFNDATSSWDRLRGDATHGAWVNIKNSSIKVDQGSAGLTPWKVDIGSNGTVTANVTFPDYYKVSRNGTANSADNPIYVNLATGAEIEIKNDSGNPIPISKNTTVNSDSNPIFVKGTSDTSFFSPTQSDAFGRLRVSNPYTLSDIFHRYQDNGLSSILTVGGGSTGYDANNAALTLSVGTGATDSVIRETDRVYAYQPGKSLLILQTFTFASPKNNLTQRAGYFDVANGFYLEQVTTNDITTINFVKRSSSSGVLTETRIPQSGVDGWNTNQLGSLNLSKSQILWIDVEWLGVGSVRMGFVIDGQFIVCHQWNHANKITGTYTTTSCLPLRREIFNTGITSSSSTMLSICNSVISEGGYSITGRTFCIGHILGQPVNLSNVPTTFTPVISIRLKSSRPGAIVLPTTFTVTPVEQAVYKYQIYTRAITTGGTWVSAGANSSVEYNLNPTSITSGNVTLSAFINATNQTSGSVENVQLPFQYQLERNSLTPTFYEIVIGVGASTNNTTCYASINWSEIT